MSKVMIGVEVNEALFNNALTGEDAAGCALVVKVEEKTYRFPASFLSDRPLYIIAEAIGEAHKEGAESLRAVADDDLGDITLLREYEV